MLLCFCQNVEAKKNLTAKGKEHHNIPTNADLCFLIYAKDRKLQ